MVDGYTGGERRQFLRYDYDKPIHYNVLNPSSTDKLISGLMDASTKNLSASGILFTTKDVPKIASLLVMDLDYRTSRICQEIEDNALIVNNRLLGKVVRIEDNENGLCDVGVAFVRRTDTLTKDVKNLINRIEKK